MNSEPIREAFEMAIAAFMFAAAMYQLIYSQDLFFKGTEALPSTETVYFNSHDLQTPSTYWTGAQVILYLKNADLEETPVQVGGVLFEREKQVEQLWKSINAQANYIFTPITKDGTKVDKVQFTLKN